MFAKKILVLISACLIIVGTSGCVPLMPLMLTGGSYGIAGLSGKHRIDRCSEIYAKKESGEISKQQAYKQSIGLDCPQ